VSSSQHTPTRDEVLRASARRGPANIGELIRDLGGPPGGRRKLRQLLRSLVEEGALVRDRKGRLHLPGRGAASPAPATGDRTLARFEGHREGFGFVNPTDGSRDLFIPRHRTAGAMHGDLVEYVITDRRPDGKREGAVLRIARPSGQRIVGLVTRIEPRVEITPFDPRSGASFHLARGARGAELAEGVAVEVEIGRGDPGGSRAARLLEVIGPITRPGVDTEVLIRKHHLRTAFPDAVLAAAERLGDRVSAQDLDGREDFSTGTVVTIDGETAKDFDDAIGVTARGRSGFTLAVHIADVAHYVKPGSPIDIEARQRGTSVYFPGRAIPMLPPPLSENLCSLRQGVPRLVQSVVMEFNAKGEPSAVRFADGWIQSRARLTYGRVNALLAGAPPAADERDLLPGLERMAALATLLARRRAERGGLDFDLPEPEVVLDALGAAAGVRPASRGPAQRLIEEFMIAANIAVARALCEKAVPVLYRVHERPDPVKVAELARVARALGHAFPGDPDAPEPADFRALLEEIAGRPEERAVSRILLRTMALARYAPDPLGHFGLATPDYLHFTSPIRRYPDLVAHRALRSMRAAAGTRTRRARRERPEAAGEDLDFLGADCSRLERAAEAAERESLAWKRAEVLLGRVGEVMDGAIASVGGLGLSVELEEVFAEGLVPIAALPADRYAPDRTGLALRGESSGRSYRAGQRIQVIVARVDRIGQRIELAIPGSPGGGVSAVRPAVGKYPRSAGPRSGAGARERGRARGRGSRERGGRGRGRS
jgi:ribonuclease R